MLKELLPKIHQTPPPQPENQPNQLNPNLNLLEGANEAPTFKDTLVAVQNSIFIKIPIIILQLVFLAVVAGNYLLNKQIERYIKSTDSLVESIQKFDGLDAAAKKVTNKLDLYKKVNTNKPRIADESKFLIENIPSDIFLKRFAFKEGNFNMTVEVANPFSLARLISTYFDEPNLKEIIIKSATLQNTTKTYVINFDVVYKQL